MDNGKYHLNDIPIYQQKLIFNRLWSYLMAICMYVGMHDIFDGLGITTSGHFFLSSLMI